MDASANLDESPLSGLSMPAVALADTNLRKIIQCNWLGVINCLMPGERSSNDLDLSTVSRGLPRLLLVSHSSEMLAGFRLLEQYKSH